MGNEYVSKYIEFVEKGIVQVKTKTINSENLGPNECIIQNEASIISAGTELATLNNLSATVSFPVIPGYGSIGRILEKGADLDDFNIGDRVFFAGKHASIQRFNHGEPHQWGYLFPFPDKLDPVEGTVGCMAEIAMTAPNISDIKICDTVIIYGLGVVGLLAAMMFQLKGAKVIGVDPVSHRCELAKKLGIKTVVDVEPYKQIDEVLRLTNGKGAEVTVDAVGHSVVISTCIKTTSMFGQVLLLGTARSPFQGDITEAFSIIHKNCLTMKGAHMWQYPVNEQRGISMDVKWAYKTVFELIQTKSIDIGPLISHVIKPEEVPVAYNGLQNHQEIYTCVVIDWRT